MFSVTYVINLDIQPISALNLEIYFLEGLLDHESSMLKPLHHHNLELLILVFQIFLGY